MLWLYESFFPVVWIAFLLYWQIKAGHTKSTQRLEPAASRIFRALIFLIAIVLFSTNRIPLRSLDIPLWPMGFWPFWLGAAITVAALCSPSGAASTSAPTGAAPSPLNRATS